MKKFFWALGVFVVILSLAFGIRKTQSDSAQVLVVEFDGKIEEVQGSDILGALSGDGGQSIHAITSNIHRAAADPSIKGIFFKIGMVDIGLAQLQDVAAAMEVFKKSGKWSVSYLDTAGEFSSGNIPFCLASTTDHITISPTGSVNLMGLRAESMFFKNTLELMDIDVLVEQRHEYKNAAAPFSQTQYTTAHKESIKSLLDDVQQTLIQMLATHRGIDETIAKDWFEQGPYSVQQAAEKGLIQHVGYYDEVMAFLESRTEVQFEQIFLSEYRETGKLYDGNVPVAVIIADGSIHRGESSSDPSVGSDTLTRAIRNARKDKVQGLLLRVNSPGGSVIASDVIRREIELTRQSGIPVVVSMGNLAASGGYYISLNADHIVAQAGTITGSIGVIAMLTSVHRSLKKNLKVTYDSYQTMDNANTFSMMKLPEGARLEKLQESVDDIYEDFVAKVAAGRNMEIEKVREVAKGRVWSGLSAQKNGLVDELGDVHLAMQRLQERMNLAEGDSIGAKVYPEDDSPLAVIRSLLSAHVQIPEEIQSLVEAWNILANPEQATLRIHSLPKIK